MLHTTLNHIIITAGSYHHHYRVIPSLLDHTIISSSYPVKSESIGTGKTWAMPSLTQRTWSSNSCSLHTQTTTIIYLAEGRRSNWQTTCSAPLVQTGEQFFTVWPWPLTYDTELQSQASQGQGRPSCQKSRSKVKRFKQERQTDGHTHGRYQTYYLPCYVLDNEEKRNHNTQSKSRAGNEKTHTYLYARHTHTKPTCMRVQGARIQCGCRRRCVTVGQSEAQRDPTNWS